MKSHQLEHQSCIDPADSRVLWKPAFTIGHKARCNNSVGCKSHHGVLSTTSELVHTAGLAETCWLKQHQLQQCLMQGKRKKVPGSSSPNWDSYFHKTLQDNYPGVKINKEARQVRAEALDAWLQ